LQAVQVANVMNGSHEMTRRGLMKSKQQNKVAVKRAGSSRRVAAGMVATALVALMPVLAHADETDKLTVEDQTSGSVMFRVTSLGNVTGASFTGDGSGLSNVPHWKGAWSAATAYSKDQVVSYGGSSYIALQPSTGVQPNLDPLSWAVLALQGPAGAAGAQGPAGVQGLAGASGAQGPAGPAGSPDTQSQILSKIATQTDNAVLTVQQGPMEPSTSVKLSVNDSAGNKKLVVDSTGHIGIGVSAPQAIQHLYADYSSDFFYGEMAFSDGWPTYKLLRARGTSVKKDPLLDGDIIGRFVMWGYDGTNYNRSGSFEVAADGAPTTGSSPGRLTFSTVSSGSASLSERMRITSSGNIGIGTTTPLQKLEVNGGVRINTVSAKPLCNSSARGTFWLTQNGAGTMDTLEVCIKDANDVYVWKSVW